MSLKKGMISWIESDIFLTLSVDNKYLKFSFESYKMSATVALGSFKAFEKNLFSKLKFWAHVKITENLKC